MAAGQTTILYGNILLLRCRTLQCNTEVIKDDSNTDMMYARTTLRVEGYFHGTPTWTPLNYIGYSGGFFALNGGSAALNYIGMRVNLPPRQPFRLRHGADETGLTGGYLLMYVEAYPAQKQDGITHLDVNNGPRCNEMIIKRVVADNIYQVEAEFEVCVVECSYKEGQATGYRSGPQTAGICPDNTKGVLSNRWTVVDNIDVNLKTTREYHGRLRVASNVINPNDFRSLVVPPLRAGLRREAIQFSVSPDGLNLDYLIRDVEVFASAPYPAKTWEISHTESIDSAIITSAACDVVLTGDRNANPSDLIIIGMNVLTAKLLGGNLAPANTVFLQSISVTAYTGDDNRVTVSGRCQRLPRQCAAGDQDVFQPWFFGNKLLGKVLDKSEVYKNIVENQDNDYDSNLSYGGLANSSRDGGKPYYDGPVDLIGAILPYLQSPCDDKHQIVPADYQLPTDGNTNPPDAPRTTISAAVDNSWTDSAKSLYTPQSQTNAYTLWKMESVFKESEMKLALPIANSGYSRDGESAAIVSLAKPQCRRVVRVEAERIGEWPELPSGSQLTSLMPLGSGTASPSLTQTFLGKRRLFAAPFYTAGAQKAYRVIVEYFFSLNRRPNDDEALPVGRTIWTTDDPVSTNSIATQGWGS